MTTFTWLHLSDLHVGQKKWAQYWSSVRQIWFKDIDSLLKKVGLVDMVLFTGDLTQRGEQAEFVELDLFLNELRDYFTDRKLSPLLIAVPGNHDLVRPESTDTSLHSIIYAWQEEVAEIFWKDPKCRQRELIAKSFDNYKSWWDNQVPRLHGRSYSSGHLPGDFSLTVEKNGLKLGIVGLNSAYLHLKDNREGKLELSLEQYHAACHGNGPDWTQRHDACLLLTHHPHSWLSDGGQQTLEEEIHSPAERFAFHLFGHMHQSKLKSEEYAGGSPRNRFQAASLFSLEEWGEPAKQKRIHGYSLYELQFNGSQAQGRIWPRIANRKDNNDLDFDPDTRFKLEKDNNCTKWRLVELPDRGTRRGPVTGVERHEPNDLESHPTRFAAMIGPRNFEDVHAVVRNLVENKRNHGPLTEVLNIALDMEYTWGLIRHNIMTTSWPNAIRWKSLMVDPSSPFTQAFNSPSSMVQVQMAKTRIDEIKAFCQSFMDLFEKNHIEFECRSYRCEPFMHGFLLDKERLYVSFCVANNTSLSPLPYLHFNQADKIQNLDGEVSGKFIEVFQKWFDQQWKNARAIWPLESASDAQ